MIEFFGFVVTLLICATLGIFVIWFAMGAFHQHLKNKGEGLGDAASRADLQRLEDKLDAALTTKH